MNYGRYFRLNQSLSKVADGVAIYDYIDLPAYFGPSVDNPMSPKYPISMTVTSNVVCFRLHYSAFKIENKDNFAQILLDDGKKRMFNRDFPQYAYNEDDINNKTLPKINNEGLSDVGMAHMEEVVLELPYTDNISSCLSDTIKDIYNSTFPQVIDENTSMGGRYIEQLIRKRYPSLNQNNESGLEGDNIEKQLYNELRKVSDDTASYSTLMLMDLYKGERIDLYTEDGRRIIGFLRKLLLDFMFDLKHSDVFQNSPNYQKMYSGLMSDFFFSALMHKCDYYYYRKLTRKAIDDANRNDRERIAKLYANELIKAEELWIKDIMSLQAERHFEHRHREDRWYQEFLGNYSFSRWPSWFAEPEEEMRRVCFTMIEKINGKKREHICNSETLIECLGIDRGSTKKTYAEEMIKSRDESYERISRWFLRRYDFNDVLHFHIAKHINLVVFAIIAGFLYWFFDAKVLFNSIFDKINDSQGLRFASIFSILIFFYIVLIHELWNDYHIVDKNKPTVPLVDKIALIQKNIYFGNKWKIIDVLTFCLIVYYWDYLHPIFSSLVGCAEIVATSFVDYIKILGNKQVSTIALFFFFIVLLWYGVRGIFVFYFKKSRLAIARRSIMIKKLVGLLFIISLFLCAYYYYPQCGKPFVLSVLIVFFIVTFYNRWFGIMPTIRPISSLHLLFPRLVAAITAAWLTMSMGFDIYVSFFDQLPSWYTALAISIIVFGFIMYEINRIMPSSRAIRKVFRSFEFLVISYCISLLVGLVVINFVGEKYLERGGYMESFYQEYVDSAHHNKSYNRLDFRRIGEVDTSTIYGKVEALSKISHKEKDDSLIIKQKILKTDHDLFIMRDFLIMFSFIAMFWGIFIQMIFTGEKQMTEL